MPAIVDVETAVIAVLRGVPALAGYTVDDHIVDGTIAQVVVWRAYGTGDPYLPLDFPLLQIDVWGPVEETVGGPDVRAATYAAAAAVVEALAGRQWGPVGGVRVSALGHVTSHFLADPQTNQPRVALTAQLAGQ